MRYSFVFPDTPLPELPPPVSDAPSVLAFSMPKAGSTLLFGILRMLCPAAGLVFFSTENHFFDRGVPAEKRPPETARLFLPTGYCYGGFRSCPRYAIPILPTARTVVLVRDPRDMIVSLYHSLQQSHRIPDGAEAGGQPHFMQRAREQARRSTLDEHCLHSVNSYAAQFEAYLSQGLLWRENVAVYRYEDVIFRKREWIEDMCRWFGWSVPERRIATALERFDIVPEKADPTRHVRQVKPGNYVDALSPESIRMVNGRLGAYMRIFGYL
jgi:hypothetical protein